MVSTIEISICYGKWAPSMSSLTAAKLFVAYFSTQSQGNSNWLRNCRNNHPPLGGILSIKTAFYEKKFLEKTVFFFYSRISVTKAFFLKIKKS
jgi:hypothetical protein